MSCRRATEIDLADFEVDRDAPEWREFRDHYPRCPDCARAVAGWARMRGALREEAADESPGHLAEAELVAFAEAPGGLAATRRQAIETHLAGCAPCRTELAVLREFDFAALGATSPAREARAPRAALGERLGAWLGELFTPLRQPAFAVAALVLLAIPVGVAVWRAFEASDAPGALPPIAREDPAPQLPAPPPPARQIAPGELAREPEPAPVPEAAPAPVAPEREVFVAREEPTPPPREEPTPEPGSEVVAEARPGPGLPPAPAPPEPIPQPLDLEALLPDAPPTYRPQLALAGGSLESVRTDTAIRGGGEELARAVPLLPEHVGATAEAAPTLYWHLSARSDVPVELTLIGEDAIEPLLELRLAPPVAAGLHALPLAAHGLRLAPDTTYPFHVALVPDEERRDLDVLATGAIRYTPAAPELETRLAEAGPARRAHVLAEAGYWIDAFAALSDLAASHPGSERAAAQRAALLARVGRGDVAAALAPPDR